MSYAEILQRTKKNKMDVKYFRHIEDDFLTPEECIEFIAMAESLGFEEAKIQTRGVGEVMNKDVRDNDRVIHENQTLANQLWELIQPLVPAEIEDHKAVGLNERFRFYRYRDGQQFKVHPDGAFKRNEFEHSKITAIIYLNSEFSNGETIFVNPFQTIEAVTGRLLLFTHGQLHKGSAVPSGTKYVLRTDVMYRREPNEDEVKLEEEIYIGDRNIMFIDLIPSDAKNAFKALASEWNEKGYYLATGKLSEDKAHELWAIKRPKSESNE